MDDAAVEVRPAGRSDAVMLHLIAAATFPLACVGTAQEDIQQHIDEHLTVERFREYAADPDRRLLVVEVSGTPAGYAMVNLARTTNVDVLALVSTPNTVELVTFYLLAGRHGSGLAGRLLSAALDEARHSGAESMWLGVANENSRANSFYDQNGFDRRGIKTFMVGSAALTDLIRERPL